MNVWRHHICAVPTQFVPTTMEATAVPAGVDIM